MRRAGAHWLYRRAASSSSFSVATSRVASSNLAVHLSRESEVIAQLAIVELLKFDLVIRPESESFASEPIGVVNILRPFIRRVRLK